MARPPRRVGNLPAETTSFIGRRRALPEVKQTLSGARLVSLVGPGGVGKTRLAVRAAAEMARGFPDGAWLVELADLRDPALVSGAVMAALDLRDQAGAEPLSLLLADLRDKRLLLVLDNCEHLLGAAAQLVADVLRAAPGVRVLATSREPLGAPGEHVVPIAPLELPAAGAGERSARAEENEAVALFAERAAAARGTFDLTETHRGVVAELCRRLDGLPLAIEMAAVRTRALSVEQILERLSDRFDLLTGGSRAALPRHQTLRATLEWSHDLLTESERTLLRRLCVFAGRFTLEDVEGVCASADAPGSNVVSSLVDKSLVVAEVAKGAASYRLHESVREFARLMLRAADEEDAVERRCVDYFVARSQHAAAGARYRLIEWLDWAELAIDNVRGCMRRCLTEGDVTRGLMLASAMGWYWITRATTEGVRWLDALLASGEGVPAVNAWAYFMRGFLAILKGDPATAVRSMERAIVAARESGQQQALAQSLAMASVAEAMVGDREAAARLLGEAQAVAETLDDVSARVAILQTRAMHAFQAGDLDSVETACTLGERLSREAGDLYSLEHMLFNLGGARLMAGDVRAARPLLEEALRIAHQIDDRIVQAHALASLSCLAAAVGEARSAARLMGAAEAVRVGAGATLTPTTAVGLERAREAAMAALGATRFDAELAGGKRDSGEVVRELARADGTTEGHVAATLPPGAGDGPLAKREGEVARLIADGLSNKEIGTRLFISERTVDSHVRNILNKLGCGSRAQIAAWVASSMAAARQGSGVRPGKVRQRETEKR